MKSPFALKPPPRFVLACAGIVLLSSAALAADFSSMALTDKIRDGTGTIDLLKNTTAAQLKQYLTSQGALELGVDVNENASGNESAKSQGVALKNVEMVITTTQGTYKFSNFSTSTSALI